MNTLTIILSLTISPFYCIDLDFHFQKKYKDSKDSFKMATDLRT